MWEKSFAEIGKCRQYQDGNDLSVLKGQMKPCDMAEEPRGEEVGDVGRGAG